VSTHRMSKYAEDGGIHLLVRRGGETVVLDFKTGAPQPHYREQLRLYALMWWRSTGDRPTTIELRYGARVERWPLTEADLLSVEAELEAKIGRLREGLSAKPATAVTGPHCRLCGVRQLCDAYWAAKANGAEVQSGGGVDVEVVVQGVMNRGGFIGRDEHGNEVAVVCEDDVGGAHGPFEVGERLRIVYAQREGDTGAIRIARGAEVFRGG